MLLMRGRPWHLTPLQLAPWQGLLAGLLLLPFAIASEGWPVVVPTARLAVILLYTGPICSGFCVWAVVAIIRALPAVTSSLSFLAVPVFGLVAATVALGEAIDPTLIGGLILILGGVALVAYGDVRLVAYGERRRS
jgi:drug/metabolite transporter (DMT)-like permease